MRQYLENGTRCVQSYYHCTENTVKTDVTDGQASTSVNPGLNGDAILIGTKIDDLAWPWPAISLNFLRISHHFADVGGIND